MKRYKDDPEKLEAVNAAYNRLMGYSTNEERKEETKKGTGFFKFLRKN